MTVQHTDVAAYSLGLLEQQDRAEFEAHLASCETCPAELTELEHMADLLAGVEPVEAEPDGRPDAAIDDLLRRRAAARQRRGRLLGGLAAAACLVLIAGGTAIGIAVSPQHPPTPLTSIIGQPHQATSAKTGVTGKVGLTSFAWGTQVTLDLAGVKGPLDCQLVAISRTGERRVIMGWLVPAAGYGVPGHPAHLVIIGGTSIPASDIARVEVEVVHGGTLVSIGV